jgi:uncharacterized protein (DUF1499 family)
MIRRRLYAEIRVSRLALWSWRAAVFAMPVIVLAVLLHRLGVLEYHVAYVLLASGLGIAALAGALAAGAFVVIWNDGLKGFGKALLAFLAAVLLLALPAFDAARGIGLPGIADITTDFVNPPRFAAIASSRPRGANAPGYPGDAAAEAQRVAYPAVRPVEFDASADEVFNQALALAVRRGWRILDSVAPRGGERDGYIEAVALTFVMGFREDVAIRIRPVEGGVRVDMRSASRYGMRDHGSNARRIEAFLRELQENRRRR